jgi:hypothetical protein
MQSRDVTFTTKSPRCIELLRRCFSKACVRDDFDKIMGTLSDLIYRVILKSVKHFKNSQQIDYVTDHGNSYADRERNSPSFFQGKSAHIVALICR